MLWHSLTNAPEPLCGALAFGITQRQSAQVGKPCTAVPPGGTPRRSQTRLPPALSPLASPLGRRPDCRRSYVANAARLAPLRVFQ
ncbi:hypothetical protein [Desmonostoc muscorum]|uniref:hypothetical protein n=1 Tax=Desmonostoc muscorum TaxID=1179 RepID=UPI001F1954BB|nr:hypothetical protein [Desmonostoc muscorum]